MTNNEKNRNGQGNPSETAASSSGLPKHMKLALGGGVLVVGAIVLGLFIFSDVSDEDLLHENFSDLRFGMTKEEVLKLYPKAGRDIQDKRNPDWFIEPNHEVGKDQQFVFASLGWGRKPGGPRRLLRVKFCRNGGCANSYPEKRVLQDIVTSQYVRKVTKEEHIKRVQKDFDRYAPSLLAAHGEPIMKLTAKDGRTAGPSLEWKYETSRGNYYVSWRCIKVTKLLSAEYAGWPGDPYLAVSFIAKD